MTVHDLVPSTWMSTGSSRTHRARSWCTWSAHRAQPTPLKWTSRGGRLVFRSVRRARTACNSGSARGPEAAISARWRRQTPRLLEDTERRDLRCRAREQHIVAARREKQGRSGCIRRACSTAVRTSRGSNEACNSRRIRDDVGPPNAVVPALSVVVVCIPSTLPPDRRRAPGDAVCSRLVRSSSMTTHVIRGRSASSALQIQLRLLHATADRDHRCRGQA
jgi:hypothetical protein